MDSTPPEPIPFAHEFVTLPAGALWGRSRFRRCGMTSCPTIWWRPRIPGVWIQSLGAGRNVAPPLRGWRRAPARHPQGAGLRIGSTAPFGAGLSQTEPAWPAPDTLIAKNSQDRSGPDRRGCASKQCGLGLGFATGFVGLLTRTATAVERPICENQAYLCRGASRRFPGPRSRLWRASPSTRQASTSLDNEV